MDISQWSLSDWTIVAGALIAVFLFVIRFLKKITQNKRLQELLTAAEESLSEVKGELDSVTSSASIIIKAIENSKSSTVIKRDVKLGSMAVRKKEQVDRLVQSVVKTK